MKRVVRLVSALSAGASLAWGIAKALRKGSKRDQSASPWPAPEKSASTEPATDSPPEPDVAPEPVAATETPASPEPVITDEPTEVVIKGVVIYKPAKLLAFVNDADDADMKSAGVKGKALAVLEGARPFASVDELGKTSGVGRRTLQALCAAAGS